MEDRFAKGHVHAGCCLCGAWRGSSYGSCASHCDGLSVPDRAMWIRKSQTDPHLQNWPKVSILPTKADICSAGQKHATWGGKVLGAEDMLNVALLLWSLSADFSIQAHFPAQHLLLWWCDHGNKIWLFDYCKGELQSMLTVTTIWSPHHHCG